MLATGLVTALGVTLAVSPSAGATTRRVDGSPTSSPARTAKETLAQAKALLAGSGPASRRRAGSAARGDATMVLTDLAHHVDDLSESDRRAARALLARPSYHGTPAGEWEHSYTVPEHTPVCAVVCVHYVTSTGDKVSSADDNHDGIPNYVSTVAATMGRVWAKEVTALGYRAPRSDVTLADNGGSALVDVYLQDLPQGLYGYCVPDTDARVTSGYCVLDNDYLRSEFPAHTPLENLQVTAAHEFFHAVQFGYDSYEDEWLMEGTAAWMEDEVFDGVNDNLQYLVESPLRNPFIPLDYSGDDYGPYGAWVFWKYLSEWAGAGRNDSPRIVRDVWAAAVGSTYSTAALQKVLVARHSSFSRAFGTFGTWMREPARYFSEGRTYPAATLDGRFTLTRAHPSTGLRGYRMSHMTHSFVRFSPGSTLTGAWRLHVAVNMADTVRGSSARLVVHRRSGGPSVIAIPLNRTGAGARTLGFSRAAVSGVELDMVNSSIRFSCNHRTYQSCSGVSHDDSLPARFSARAIR
jgi:hypothetical protein